MSAPCAPWPENIQITRVSFLLMTRLALSWFPPVPFAKVFNNSVASWRLEGTIAVLKSWCPRRDARASAG